MPIYIYGVHTFNFGNSQNLSEMTNTGVKHEGIVEGVYHNQTLRKPAILFLNTCNFADMSRLCRSVL